MLKLMQNTSRDQICRDFRNARLPTAPTLPLKLRDYGRLRWQLSTQATLVARRTKGARLSRRGDRRKVSSIFVCSARVRKWHQEAYSRADGGSAYWGSAEACARGAEPPTM